MLQGKSVEPPILRLLRNSALVKRQKDGNSEMSFSCRDSLGKTLVINLLS